MSLQNLILKNVEFNEWANRQCTEWLAAKPDDLLYQEVASSYSSIMKTLHHILVSQEYWWGITSETGIFISRSSVEDFTKDEIFAGLNDNSQKLVEYVKTLSDGDLSKTLKIENEWFECDFPKYEYIQHLVTHATYHRGQIVTIGRNVGITDAPMSDYNFWNIVANKN